MKGSEFIATLPEVPSSTRETKILDAVRAGLHLPIVWVPIESEFEGHRATIFVSEDALSIGEPDDFIRVTVSHRTSQQIADVLGVALPTTHIYDLAYAQAEVVLRPCLQHADDFMAYTSRMARHHREIETQRQGRKGLIREVGKAFVLSNRLAGRPKKAANYGWHSPDGPRELCDGTRGWQPLGLAHDIDHVDYSQMLWFVRNDVRVDGVEMALSDVLRSPDLWGLVSNEGPLLITRHPGVPAPAAPTDPQPQQPETSSLGERAVAVALRELSDGVCEVPPGANTSPRIRTYFGPCVRDFRLPGGIIERRKVGIVAGAWCAAFASFCGKEADRPGERMPYDYRCSVAELWKDAVASGAARPGSYSPVVGDLAIFLRDGQNPTQGGKGHVARVCTAPDAEGNYETIDGNHGDRVARVRRKLGDAVGWIVEGAQQAAPRGLRALAKTAVAIPECEPLLRLADAMTGAGAGAMEVDW